MFSSDHYLATGHQNDPGIAIDWLWSQFCGQFQIEALLLVKTDISEKEVRVASGYGIPVEPFNGMEHIHLVELLNVCFSKYPKPHIHALPSHLGITPVLKHLLRLEKPFTRVCFVPVNCYGSHYVLLAFPSSSQKEIADEMVKALDRVISVISFYDFSSENSERLKTTEQFIKEIGHDIASSVQSIIGKARTIRDGRLQDSDSIKRKARDIEDEIRTVYGTAEMLGLVIDPNYQLRSFTDFDVIPMVKTALDDLRAVANERNIAFSTDFPTTSIKLWGDERALQQCVIQLLLNAIKYSFGGSFIKIFVANNPDSVHLHISNRGHELPKGEELKRIWDFGFRGAKAKELHVNGSGIGLFTTRKIVNAHHGRS